MTRGVRDALRGPGAASGDDSKGLPAGVADDLAGALLVALDAGLAMTQAALDSYDADADSIRTQLNSIVASFVVGG